MIKELIKAHEGFREHMYECTAGKTTIGYGLNLDAGMDEGLADHILSYQIARITEYLHTVYPWYKHLDMARKAVVVDMVFNLGRSGFAKFKKTIAYIESGDYVLASQEMLRSRWARQVGNRAITLSLLMEEGELR